MSNKKKSRLNFSKNNSRIDFGSLIFEAAKQRDHEGLELILAQEGADRYINHCDRSGLTPLTMAAKNNDLKSVKVLLANKCDLYSTGTHNGYNAWDMAAKLGSRRVTQYLNGCVDDLLKYKYHRAMMEADVMEIIQCKKMHKTDLREFDKHMERLITMDTFDIDGDETTNSLLIIAARANNTLVVRRLLEKYKVTPYSNDLKTGDTALHIACSQMSTLRFYLTKNYPDLLYSVDVNGVQPLHIACQNNDITFFTWLFRSVLEDMERSEAATDNDSVFYSLRPNVHSPTRLPSRMSQPKLTQPQSVLDSMDSISALHRQLPTQVSEEDEGPPLQVQATTFQKKLFSLNQSEEFETSKDTLSETISIIDELPSTLLSPDPEKPINSSVHSSPNKYSQSPNSTSSSSSHSSKDLHANHSPIDALSWRHKQSTQIETSDSFSDSFLLSRQYSTDNLQSSSGTTLSDHGSPRNARNNVEDSFLFSVEASTFLESTNSILRETCSNYGPSPLSVKTILSLHMRLFAVEAHGLSVLHITAKEGYADLLHLILRVAKHLEYNPDGADVNVLTRNDSCLTPIEQAISSCQPKCLWLLLSFASETPIFNNIIEDTTLLSKAVIAGNFAILKVLIEYGIWKGLKRAIDESITRNEEDILRLLMFYYTQVLCVLKGTRVKRNREVCLESGCLRWEDLDLGELRSFWFEDAKLAITSVSHTLRVNEYHHPVEQNRELFVNLGKECIDYFTTHVWQPAAHPKAWMLFQLSEIKVSGNRLQAIPPEIFQIQTLEKLNLSNNQLQALPSSLDFQHPLYTCTNLVKLQLNGNCLKMLPEDLFFTVGNCLEELDARDNQIENLPPGLWICTKLHTLLLGQNKLSQLHYYSGKIYFYDQNYSRFLTNGIHVERGVPMNSGKIGDVQFMNVMNYVTRLNVFYQTVEALLPGIIEDEAKARGSLFQHVIDIHWLRTKLNSDKTISLDYIDVSLPPEEACSLRQLDLSRNRFKTFPWDLVCVAPNLEKLDFRGNRIESMDLLRDIPAHLQSVILSDNKITTTSNTRPVLPCANPVKLLSGYLADPKLIGHCQHTQHCVLDKLTNLIINNNHLTSFPCAFKVIEEPRSNRRLSFPEIPFQPYFPSLSVLSLDDNNLEAVPEGVHHLTQLSSLSLSHNSSISRLPPEMGLMNPQVLLILKLEGVYPKNINQNLLDRPGARGILTYLKSLYQKSLPYHRIKLMFIGNSNVGKTSLLLNLTCKGKVTHFKEVERGVNKQPLSTVGVNLGDWEYQNSRRPKVTFMTWDFGGQEEYYATHQCFLTQRSLYVLVWNVETREKGLESLKPWLENIGGRVPGAPVIVVGTHIDSIPHNRREDTLKSLQTQFRKMYRHPGINQMSYPNIHSKCFFVSCTNGNHINTLRDEIYDFALSMKPPAAGIRRSKDVEPLLRQHVPECYVKLQDIVRTIASKCSQEKKPPILNTAEFRQAASDGKFPGKLDELEQGIQFLHENGILLHYEDPALSDVYFVDPQWLCTMLACVVTVQEKNPFQKNGFMELSALQLVLRDERFPHSLIKEFVSLMQKFEVILLLDENRLLIPSLLPPDEGKSCVVFPISVVLYPGISIHAQELSQQSFSRVHVSIFARYYFLPFIPNGFFPRLLARVVGSKISECFTQCVPSCSDNDGNMLHWRCWRSGIVLVYDHLEVLRISPIYLPLPNTDETRIISSCGDRLLQSEEHSIIQILVSVLPENLVTSSSSYLPSDDSRQANSHLAIWILRQLLHIVDSVFDDWYDAFAHRKGFDLHTVEQVSPCSKCLQHTLLTQSKRRDTFISTIASQFSSYMSTLRIMYLFTSPFCVLAASKNELLTCPYHGPVPVSDIAPDLAFADFASNKLFHEPDVVIKKLEALGSGGFGSVYKGTLEGKELQQSVAIKEFNSLAGRLEDNDSIREEVTAWDIYLNGSREARMMHHLKQEHVVNLIGLAFQPLRLVLELAPMGDLKACMKPFKRTSAKLNRRTLRAVIFQVADAMEYLHSLNIIYRDLKPGNILVWEFPDPMTQWREDSSVFIKIADYGISKHCTPEGVRGSEGTPNYLPPEVVLHGGTASFSTKLDVYSFGMFMYYLFTIMGPFETEKGRPVSALLDEGKRPELAAVNRPPALQMYELMCWCWSEKPQHRPLFSEIKEIIKSSIFIQLLDATSLTTNNDTFTTACVHSYKQPHTRARHPEDSITHKPLLPSPSPSIVSILAASTEEEGILQVWYGTEKGKLGFIQFLTAETICGTVDQFRSPVSSISVVGSHVWVATLGEGLLVYNVMNTQNHLIAKWGDNEVVFKLLHAYQSSYMFVLTSKGLMLFEANFNITEGLRIMSPKQVYQTEPVLMMGVVATPRGKLEDTEIWCCSKEGGTFKIFNGYDYKMHGVKQFTIPEVDKSIQQLESYDRDEENKIAVATGHLLYQLDVTSRQTDAQKYNCHLVCYEVYGDCTQKSVITSLLPVKDLIYIGTKGGIIVVLNHRTQETVHFAHAYNEAVNCLLPINRARQIRRFARLNSHREILSPKFSFEASSFNSSGERSNSDRTLVLSFGRGYRGIVGNYKNFPPKFIPPSDNSFFCTLCLCSSRLQCTCGETIRSCHAKPDSETGYMLCLSNEEYVMNDSHENHRLSTFSVSTIHENSEIVSSTTS